MNGRNNVSRSGAHTRVFDDGFSFHRERNPGESRIFFYLIQKGVSI